MAVSRHNTRVFYTYTCTLFQNTVTKTMQYSFFNNITVNTDSSQQTKAILLKENQQFKATNTFAEAAIHRFSHQPTCLVQFFPFT